MSLCDKRQVTKLRQQENVLSRLEPPTGSHHFTKNRRFLVRLTLRSRWILPRRVVRERTAGAQRNFWAHCASLRGSWPLFASCFVVAWATQGKSTGTVFQVIWKGFKSLSKCCSLKEKNLFIPLLPGPLRASSGLCSASCLAQRWFCLWMPLILPSPEARVSSHPCCS